MVFFSVFGAVTFLVYAASFGALFVFALVNLSLLKHRRENPYLNRPFKTPIYPLTPILGVVISCLLLLTPIFSGDIYAIDALVIGNGLIVLLLLTYQLMMLGFRRLRIAMGGISVSVGISFLLMATLTDAFAYLPFLIIVLVSAVFIVAGVLNFIVNT